MKKLLLIVGLTALFCAVGAAENLLENSDFTQLRKGKPANWSWWHQKGGNMSVTQVETDGKKAVCIENSLNGSLGQRVPVTAGKEYTVSLTGKLLGNSNALFFIRYYDAAGKRMNQKKYVFSSRKRGSWETVSVRVVAPENSVSMLLMIGVKGQQSAEDKMYLTDVTISGEK
ncbi:MAG: hypothetical protein E7041_05035 [Lentisphaerae bacterium]|nr:hypothetical protein [Lentisphaerota bacterium]